MRSERLRLADCLLAASLLVSLSAAQSRAEEATARYRECLQRKPFTFHTEGRSALAGIASPETLQTLIGEYRKPPSHDEWTRYQLAELFGSSFTRKEYVAPFAELRQQFGKPTDAWLWAKTLRIEIDHEGDANALEIANGSKQIAQRAAAILALGESNRGNLTSAIVANCAEFPRAEGDRMLLVGAMTGALIRQKSRVNSEEYRNALRAYIGLLAADVKLPHLAKVQIARHLQEILRGPAQFVDPEPWLELLERGEVKTKTDNRTSAKPRFFGIETEGERFVYVVDMSDSMCKEIEPTARPAGPITGPKKKTKKSMVLDESDLPWHQIRTRWDLAREQLRISLSRLPADKYFSIVWFGTDAGTLEATKGMVKASKGNIKRALAELDSIQPGEKDPAVAPDGKLRGRTNVHFGLRIAFGLTDKGYVAEHAYVDKEALSEGCDTIFLLSDGAPSWDEFGEVDRDYGEGNVVLDTEYNTNAPRTPQLEYQGPYSLDDWLVRDLERLNAFRRIRMHCVGLGEANERLLDRMAEIGRGEVFIVGRAK